MNVPTKELICPQCGRAFVIRGYELRKTPPRKFCSRACKHRGLQVHQPARQMSPEEAAWFAGILDGEGWINWPHRTEVQTFRIGIANTCLPLVERVAEVTGTGNIRPRKPQNQKHSPSWVWYAYSANARLLLEAALPWLIVKREFAEIALGIRAAAVAPATARGLAQQQRRGLKEEMVI